MVYAYVEKNTHRFFNYEYTERNKPTSSEVAGFGRTTRIINCEAERPRTFE